MFHGTPNCPDCGSRFLVTTIRIHGGNVSPPDLTVYRCYRCFRKFTDEDLEGPTDDAGIDGGGDAGTDVSSTGEHPIRVIDVDIRVSSAGEKRAVDGFALTLRNEGPEPVRVARATLSFPDDEEAVAPVDPVVLGPDETATAAVARDWLHPGQDAITVRLIDDGDVVGSVHVTDLD